MDEPEAALRHEHPRPEEGRDVCHDLSGGGGRLRGKGSAELIRRRLDFIKCDRLRPDVRENGESVRFVRGVCQLIFAPDERDLG